MTMCPICGSKAEALDRTGDADGFDCLRHGKFKVAGTVLTTKNATRQEWEAALEKARAKSEPGVWPCITTGDF